MCPIEDADINNRDQKYVKNATHLIKLRTNSVSTGEQTLTISLKKQMPQWLNEASTMDDSDIMATVDKTFGLEYLIQGMMDAFSPVESGEEYLFSLSLELER